MIKNLNKQLKEINVKKIKNQDLFLLKTDAKEEKLPPLKEKASTNRKIIPKIPSPNQSFSQDELPSKVGRPVSLGPVKQLKIDRNQLRLINKEHGTYTLDDFQIDSNEESDDRNAGFETLLNKTIDHPPKYRGVNGPRTLSEYKILPNYDSNELVILII